MKNILLLTIITVLACSGFGQKKSFDDLTLNLAAVKSSLLLMEPIPIKLTLANKTDSTVKVSSCLTIVGGAVRLEIKKPNGKVVAPSQLSFVNGRMFCSLLPKELIAGESIENSELYSFEHYKHFGTAGEYQVRATFRNDDGKTVRSGWVKLSVEQPEATDKDAYEYLLKRMEKQPKDFRPFTSWSLDEMEEFVLLHHATRYADYVRYDLGRSYYERETERAEAHLRQIQSKNFVYAQEVNDQLKKIESRKNQTKEN